MAASRLVLLLVCLSAAAVRADDECACDSYTDEEKNKLWEFLKENPDGVEHEGVLPAVLACNCIEYDRKKRTILPALEDVEKSQQTDLSDTDSQIDHSEDTGTYPMEQDPRCPIGYARIGYRCIPFDEVF